MRLESTLTIPFDDTSDQHSFDVVFKRRLHLFRRRQDNSPKLSRQQSVGGGGTSTPTNKQAPAKPEGIGATMDHLIVAIRHTNFASKQLSGSERQSAYDAKITLCTVAAIIGGPSGYANACLQSGNAEPMLILSLRGLKERYTPHVPIRVCTPEIKSLVS